MFPFQNFQITFNPFEVYQGQMCPTYDFSNVYMQLHNQAYQSYPQLYFQQIFPFKQFSQTTHCANQNLLSFGSPSVEKFVQLQNQRTIKCDSSTSFDQNVVNESKGSAKTKYISKKGSEKRANGVESQKKMKKISNQSKYNESQYSIQEENRKRSQEQHHLYLKYRRKNTESNIVNRIYSFLTTQFKNKKEVLRLELSEEKKQTYLKYLNLVNDAWRGPVKRQLLKSLMNPDMSLPGFRSISKICGTEGVLSVQQFSYLNRILIRTYLSKIAGISVITSKKMKKSVWKEHLQKIRQLKEYFFYSSEPGLEYQFNH